MSAAGTVIEVDNARTCGSSFPATGWHFVLALEGGTATVGIGPWTDPKVKVGDSLMVEWNGTFQVGGYSSLTSVAVRDQSGQLLFWIGQNASLNQLPPEVSYQLGPQLCETIETCGSWERRSLELAIEGSTATVAPESTATVGPFEVRLGAVELQTDTQSVGCSDWFVHNVSLGVFRN